MPQSAISTMAKQSSTRSAWLLFMLMAGFVVLGIYSQQPPAAVSSDAPASQFSSGRAFLHLEQLAQVSNPAGSPHNAEVRAYVLDELQRLGLPTQVQRASVIQPRWQSGGDVVNIMARLPGNASSKAVLVVSHYDTVARSFGASDNKAAVAAMLEAARALQAGASLQNDIIFLFTDGEEVGLLGAKAFVEGHAWAADVGVVVNLEARGTGGPAMMFETSDGNGWLIQGFAASTPSPVANSASFEIYQRMSNDTDFSMFKQDGFGGLNFAFMDKPLHYHTVLDSLANLDERSLQHHGANVVALARHFGDSEIKETASSNRVYFDVLGQRLIHYPTNWVIPLLLFTGGLLLCNLRSGFARGWLGIKGILIGLGYLLIGLVSAPVVVQILVMLFTEEHVLYGWLQRYVGLWYLGGFAALTLAIAGFFTFSALGRIKADELTVAGQFLWLCLAALTSLFVPGVSYLFIWPLLFSVLLTGIFPYLPAKTRFLALLAAAAPPLLLWSAFLRVVFLALDFGISAGIMVMIVLLLALLIPQFAMLGRTRRFAWAGLWVTAAIGCFLVVAITSGATVEQPDINTMLYHYDADDNTAVWASIDREPDAFTRQFLGENYETAPLRERLVGAWSIPTMFASAPVLSEPLVNVRLIEEGQSASGRSLHLRLVPTEPIFCMTLWFDPQTLVGDVFVAGQPVPWMAENPSIRYYGPQAAGIDVRLTTTDLTDFPLTILEHQHGLPEPAASLPTRAATVIPAPTDYTDSTFVTKTWRF